MLYGSNKEKQVLLVQATEMLLTVLLSRAGLAVSVYGHVWTTWKGGNQYSRQAFWDADVLHLDLRSPVHSLGFQLQETAHIRHRRQSSVVKVASSFNGATVTLQVQKYLGRPLVQRLEKYFCLKKTGAITSAEDALYAKERGLHDVVV